MENIIIDIKSDITQIDGESNKIEMSTVGELFVKAGSIFIVYYESEVSGMQGCKTILKITGDVIAMTRFGDTTSKIIYDIAKPMNSIYHTPYGDFDMEVKTIKLFSDIDHEELVGTINLEYNITLENFSSSINKLDITVRKAINNE